MCCECVLLPLVNNDASGPTKGHDIAMQEIQAKIEEERRQSRGDAT